MMYNRDVCCRYISSYITTNKYCNYTSSRITKNTFSCITEGLCNYTSSCIMTINILLYIVLYNDNKYFIIHLLV